MNTNNNNSSRDGKKTQDGFSAGQTAGVAMGAAIAGGGIAAAATELMSDHQTTTEPTTVVHPQEQSEQHPEQPVEAPQEEVIAETIPVEQLPVDDPMLTAQVVEEPVAVTSEIEAGATVMEVEPVTEISPTPEDEELIAVIDELEEEFETLEGQENEGSDEWINSVADDIIAIQEVDPTDLDVDDILSFSEIGCIYTEEGDVLNCAVASIDGYDVLLVDVDGDLAYDILVDDATGDFEIIDGLITQADVELELSEQDSYLAADDVTQDIIDQTDFSADMMS